MKTFGVGLACVLGFFGVIWILQGNDFFIYKVFAPKYEAVRRQTFEESKAYNQGVVQELDAMYFEYQQADAAHKSALASVILHRAADYDENRLPEHLKSFIEKLRSDRGAL